MRIASQVYRVIVRPDGSMTVEDLNARLPAFGKSDSATAPGEQSRR
jgi:hypothetical protein